MLNVFNGRDAQLYEEVQAQVVTATRRSFRHPIHNSSCCPEFVRAGLLEHYSALLQIACSATPWIRGTLVLGIHLQGLFQLSTGAISRILIIGGQERAFVAALAQ